jgi:hypothetical protein
MTALKGLNVMKTPWRFLADLVSRKPPAAPTLRPRHEIRSLEFRPVEKDDVGPILIGEVSKEDDDARLVGAAPIINDTKTVIAPDVTEAIVASDHASLSSSTSEMIPSAVPVGEEGLAAALSLSELVAVDPDDKARQQPAPKRKIKDARQNLDETGTPLDGIAAKPAAPKTFSEEMTDLDQEIRSLRKQLAGKLTQQNAYLNRMLKRYEKR